MRAPVEPGTTVDDVPSRRGAPPPPARKTTPSADRSNEKSENKKRTNTESASLRSGQKKQPDRAPEPE
jgi:hypothetical protein